MILAEATGIEPHAGTNCGPWDVKALSMTPVKGEASSDGPSRGRSRLGSPKAHLSDSYGGSR